MILLVAVCFAAASASTTSNDSAMSLSQDMPTTDTHEILYGSCRKKHPQATHQQCECFFDKRMEDESDGRPPGGPPRNKEIMYACVANSPSSTEDEVRELVEVLSLKGCEGPTIAALASGLEALRADVEKKREGSGPVFDVAYSRHSGLTVEAAKLAVEVGCLDFADKQYRGLIEFYTGGNYQGLRDTATIGVDDVRGARAGHSRRDGHEGGSCYGNGTCNAHLTCSSDSTCVSEVAAPGTAGGVCYGNGTCNTKLVCGEGKTCHKSK